MMLKPGALNKKQNIPRKHGVRGQYIPKPGHVFFACDYSQLELCTLAESCFTWYGKSVMRELINLGTDLHTWFGKEIDQVGLHTDKNVDIRTLAKCGSFGFPGGLGRQKFKIFAKTNYGVELTEDQCVQLKELWLKKFPEMAQHLKPPKDPEWPEKYIGRTTTGRLRHNCEYCASANYPFTKEADVKPDEFRERHLTASGNPEPSLSENAFEGATTNSRV